MRLNLRTKLIIGFVVVVLISGLVATLVGIHFIGRRIVEQAQNNVRMDLNSAREVYENSLDDMKQALYFTVLRDSIKNALANRDRESLVALLTEVRNSARVDILTITDKDGHVVARSRNSQASGDSQADDEIVRRALSEREVVAGTAIVPREELLKEGEDLAEQAHIVIIATPQAKPKRENEQTASMMLKAAAPIFDDNGKLLGVLYAGQLLNRNYSIVDKVKDILYKGEKYNGKDIGTATIFQEDLRISTNVLKADGSRAIGTRVSEAVYDQVLLKGESWIARAFVVNDWYISAYEPIKDITGRIIGILYVGLLEQKFTDMERETTLGFLGVTLAGMLLALAVSYALADSIKLRAYTERQLLRSERLASLGRLAAGVAHEINNPLTGVLTFGHLLLRKCGADSPQREGLETIVNETARCKRIVRELLDFARQTEPQKVRADVNDVLQESLRLTENQALVHNVKIVRELNRYLPEIMLDKAQIQQVFVNIVVNAIDAMPDGGILTVSSDLTPDRKSVETRFADTGCGIAAENIGRVLDPFFTTKDISKGTGLGLAVSYGIVARHNGSIEVQSQLGEGSTFSVRLPVDEEG